MSGVLERRWDDAVEGAWREFRQRLADRLVDLDDDESVVVGLLRERETEGVAPGFRAVAGGGSLRIEVASDALVDEALGLDEAQAGALEALGFERTQLETTQLEATQTTRSGSLAGETPEDPGPTTFVTDVEQRKADLAAVVMVRALREVFAVVHPVWLDAGGLEPRRLERPLPPRGRADEPMAPRNPEEVRVAVDRAVDGLCEPPPEWDEDGDLPLVTERSTVWVTVSQAMPRILLHATLLEDVADEPRALLEVNLLNQREFGLTFSLRDGRIAVTRELGVGVVVPEQLRMEIERLVGEIDGWVSDLSARLAVRGADGTGGRGGGDGEEAADSRFATAYDVMRELERAERDSVDAPTLARIFHHDTGLLLHAIRATEAERAEWRKRAEQWEEAGRHRLARSAQGRQRYLRALRSRLRGALRLVVEAPVRKVNLDQLALFDEDECGTSR